MNIHHRFYFVQEAKNSQGAMYTTGFLFFIYSFYLMISSPHTFQPSSWLTNEIFGSLLSSVQILYSRVENQGHTVTARVKRRNSRPLIIITRRLFVPIKERLVFWNSQNQKKIYSRVTRMSFDDKNDALLVSRGRFTPWRQWRQ